MKAMNISVNNVGHAKEANSFTVSYFLMALMLKALTFNAAETEEILMPCCFLKLTQIV